MPSRSPAQLSEDESQSRDVLSKSEREVFVRGKSSTSKSFKTLLQHPEGLHQMPPNSSRMIFSDYFQDRVRPRCWQHIFVNPWFERIALVLIVFNAFWIGFDVDYNVPDSDVPSIVFEAGDSMFAFLFSFELIVRFMAYSQTCLFFRDPDMYLWNIFDLFLVTLMVTDTWVLTYIVKVEASQIQALSTLRLLRLLRLSRILRLVPELGMMVTSLMAAIRSVASTCILGVGIMYIFAIFFVQWTKSYGSAPKCIGPPGYEICLQEYFGSLMDAFLTLTQILTFDDTFEVVRPIFDERFGMGLLLIIYMLLVCFTVLNMLIGIICDVVAEVSNQEKEKLLRVRMEDLFRHLDADQSGFVSREEFEVSGALEHLTALGIEPHLTQAAFDMIDIDGDGMITCSEFVTMIFKCLHAVDTEDIMKLEASVDRIAERAGIGREAVAILEKDRDKLSQAPRLRSETSGGVDAATSYANNALDGLDDMQRQEEKPVLRQFDEVHKRLEDLQLLIEAGPCTSISSTLQNGADSYQARVYLPGLPSTPQIDALAPVLRPALRVLTARLHALRAECKAANLQYVGDLTSSLGPKKSVFVSLLHLRPLDELITEGIQRITFTNDHLFPPEPVVVSLESADPPVLNGAADGRDAQRSSSTWRGVLNAVGAAARKLSNSAPPSESGDAESPASLDHEASSFMFEDEAEPAAVRTGIAQESPP